MNPQPLIQNEHSTAEGLLGGLETLRLLKNTLVRHGLRLSQRHREIKGEQLPGADTEPSSLGVTHLGSLVPTGPGLLSKPPPPSPILLIRERVGFFVLFCFGNPFYFNHKT